MKWNKALHPRGKDGKFKPKRKDNMSSKDRHEIGTSFLSAIARDTTSKGGKANWPKKGRR